MNRYSLSGFMTSGTRAIKKAIEKIEERTPFLRDPKKVQSKIEAYRVIGFKNPEKMMRKFPPMLGLDIEWNVKPKIEAHRALGFKNPEKMIGNSPQQWSYNIETSVKPKIEAYRKIGLNDAERMIEALPAMLGYDINNNIRPKLRYIHQLLRCFHVPFDKDRLAKDFLAFFGCKKEKIQLCARILSRSHVPSPVSFSQLSKILRINIEQLILASSELSAGHSLANLLQKSEEIKTRNLSSDQKTARILAECDRKIVQIYQRGYREKRK